METNDNIINARVRLLSVKGTTDLKESQSLSHQRSVVDIYTNSWGPPDGKGYYDTGSLVKAALLSGVTTVINPCNIFL
ncbi:hypothetical protein CHS0354_022826 [Potamilus streckersoni]|uniref:Uncharacterized protein n=1 Tax=Potamilus streckersoni TaxID=2493646 RepID=A0AAE0VN65_9BIVA|nr:hypothetical protein CHS0354_022826 [Potamilus streckersoni]